ncbi:hypothetical protein PoB_004882800 [Plakobranchus ocellatus]|uniref:Uncharacterized protein n=1 Tax=Plakobranchus ocellatus TaxID=259542 RepID=A0AAV4BT05_9GAST|nr:hypothetical protein PoB_004882800 [Plakobranchus ocellatus]
MSRRTMSGSELLAHSKNRHEQKNLREKLDELTHGQFLVRDTSRVETQKLRQFLKDNHRNTGWSPMAMKPEVPGEGEGGSDSQETLGGAPRRRYDLQAIKKYQRPWAYTLNTGDSPNKVYRELAQAGQSSKKALYTPRQATLALLGAVSFARGRIQAGRHPRLANTVPAVVGLERAKSAWIPGAHSNAGTFDAYRKLLSFRQNLKPTPFSASDQQNQYETTVTFSTRGKSKLERQVSTVSAVTRAKSSWFRGSKPATLLTMMGV